MARRGLQHFLTAQAQHLREPSLRGFEWAWVHVSWYVGEQHLMGGDGVRPVRQEVSKARGAASESNAGDGTPTGTPNSQKLVESREHLGEKPTP